jgi:hypothetical protein
LQCDQEYGIEHNLNEKKSAVAIALPLKTKGNNPIYLHRERTKVVRTILWEPVAADLDTIAANTMFQQKKASTKRTTIEQEGKVSCCGCVWLLLLRL